jgi:hypothetical protein
MLEIRTYKFRLIVVASLFLLLAACSSGGGGGDGSDSGVPAISELAIGDGEFSLQLSWEETNQREDGSPIGDTLSYRIHYSFGSSGEQVAEVGAVNSVLLLGLQAGEYSFAVSSVDSSGMESGLSERVVIIVG